MPGQLTDYKPQCCQVALDVLKQGKSLAAVCVALDICRQTLTNWRNANPEFNDAVNKGLNASQAYWESIGETGVVGGYEKFAGSPWMFTMKSRFREDYAEEKDSTNAAVSLLEKALFGDKKDK